jgi:8-oxo-dGTP pyrophosphatase MutT (NUDIX family)
MSEPLVPRPAATVMMVRDGDDGFEVLMLRRNLNSDFVGGAYVFPGGGVDEEDSTSTAEHRVEGVTDATASKRLDLDAGGLAYYVACLRELFEEAGLLVALDDNNQPVRFDEPAVMTRFAQHRRAVNDREVRFLDVVAEENLRLDLSRLEYVAHWVTPVGPPRRYDTRFFIAVAPEAQLAAHDQGETIADLWVRPHDALERQSRGELEMIFPTIRNLEAIASFSTASDVLAYARSLSNIARIEPQIVSRDGEIAILLPGDTGFVS